MLYIIISIIVIIVCGTALVRFSKNKDVLLFFILMAASIVCGIVSGLNLPDLLNVIKRGFAETIAGIGLVIVTGHMYGAFMFRAGVIDSFAGLITRIGKGKHESLALAAMGGLVSIPATCETGYSMLHPLAQQVSQKSGTAPAAAISLACGMYVTHCLVVPTAGPLAASGIMNANIMLLFALGLAVSIPAIFAADFFSRKYAAKYDAAEMPGAATAAEKSSLPTGSVAALMFACFPLLLILTRGIASLPVRPAGSGILYRFIYFAGDPFVALLISISALILYCIRKKLASGFTELAAESLNESARVLLIAAAAGAFAAVFRTSMVMKVLPVSLPHWAGLFVPFMAAALFKMLHGNSTAAMISACSVAFSSIYGLRINPELAVLAAGAGAMVVSHANDPYFWIVSRFSGMDAGVTYKLFTMSTLVCGLVTFLAVFLLGLFI